ncbi:S24 family peptidase [Campylobacter corcagiensis]|uniref:LexA family transcriptional regulator n=1 Tax=Campylobacter corcagiensis TaxID=1448857 RepID=A0A7M1LIC4_9BACT|nr:LexA family transcriptional regulator [Campylobacter corcagiensis]QKF64582.1 peptidase S24 LexA-like protein [Campylobacter corcagiensis]QOQ87245.1 LexA family transcriptional regulator [Campylobacter corcagiensis]
MGNINDILNRLYHKLNIKSDAEFCRKYNIKQNTLSTWKARNSIPYELLLSISKEENIPVDYIFLNKNFNTSHNENNGYKIKKISHNASAGTLTDIEGIEVYDTDDFIFISKNLFKTNINPEKTRIVEVVGDSMSPTLNSGDYVIINIDNNFIGDGIYVINYKNIFMVKMLQQKPDGLKIKSINPLYESYELEEDSQEIFDIIGKVIKTIS